MTHQQNHSFAYSSANMWQQTGNGTDSAPTMPDNRIRGNRRSNYAYENPNPNYYGTVQGNSRVPTINVESYGQGNAVPTQSFHQNTGALWPSQWVDTRLQEQQMVRDQLLAPQEIQYPDVPNIRSCSRARSVSSVATLETLPDESAGGQELYLCRWEGCDPPKIFRRGEDLVRHVRTIHVFPDEFRCEICNKVFNRRDNLAAHVRRRHGNGVDNRNNVGEMVSGGGEQRW